MSEPILVGVALRDDDVAPIALGRDLARFMGAPLVLVHAYRYEPSHRTPTPEFEAALREHALTGLEPLAAPLREEHDVTIDAVRGSSPVRGLHDAALAHAAGAVVIGSSHRGAVRRVMPGGVGERLLHAAPCAVAVAPRGYQGGTRFRRIGVGFCDTPESHEALNAAATLAALGDAELVVSSVLAPPRVGSGGATPGWVRAAPYDAQPRMRAAEERVRAALPDDMDARVVVEEGDPAELLAALSPELDLLLCGSRGYGPLRTVLLGGVSGRLVHLAACPVLVLPRAADRALATR